MAVHEFPLVTVVQTFENGTVLLEHLLNPELSFLGPRADRTADHLVAQTERLLRTIDAVDLYRRQLGSRPEVRRVEVEVAPPPRQAAWEQPVSLSFFAVVWSHPAPRDESPRGEDAVPRDEAWVGFVPALRIAVLVRRPEDLDRQLAAQIRAALLRLGANVALERLTWLQRCERVDLLEQSCLVERPSPKQAATAAQEQREKAESVLGQVATDLAAERPAPAYEVEALVRRLADTLTGRVPRSVLLVGPSGVGKTAAVHELVRRRRDYGLGNTPFWATSGARLVAGMTGFGMWQERCQKMWREAARLRAILHLGNLLELLEVGRSEHQAQGIASFLRPGLGRGEMLAVAECTPEQLAVIERQDPALLATFHQIPVEEPDSVRGRAILESFALAHRPGGLPIESEALNELDRLHRRHATYSAYPGRPLRFLRHLLADLPADRCLTLRDVRRAFARETGLPTVLLDENETLDLDKTRDWFAARVLGQPEAVELVLDLLATIKAGLARPRKPLASLLFIGPTGVGKTELAKALAEFLFGSVQRLTRFDMSEYGDPLAVQRLIGGTGQEEGLLTARVREQPFSVILLDEVEKADPLFFDLLLQVLGEGRLTDAHGRLADFQCGVVLMTSNLGAESYQKGAVGLAPSPEARTHARDHFTRAVRAFVRPELFNRIDRIVPFAPLDRDTILHVAGRQLDLIRRRDGIRYRGVRLEVGEDVAAWLADRGFDARHGARPLKRAMERELLAPLADQLNEYTADTPLDAAARLDAGALAVRVRARTGDGAPGSAGAAVPAAEAEVMGTSLDLRRAMQRLQHSAVGRELENTVFWLQQLQQRKEGRRLSVEDEKQLSQLPEWQAVQQRLRDLFAQVCRVEEQGLFALYGQEVLDETLRREIENAQAQWEELLLDLYLLRERQANEITVAVFSEEPVHLLALVRAYDQVARRARGSTVVWQFLAGHAAGDGTVPVERRLVVEPERLFAKSPTIRVQPWDREKKILLPAVEAPSLAGVIGYGLEVRCPAAWTRFAGEDGLHVFQAGRDSARCLVLTTADKVKDYTPPKNITRRGAIGNQPRRRLYALGREEIEDFTLNRRLRMRPEELHLALAELLDERLQKLVHSLLVP
jgi:ATP-dependent Clp protease ATP-binding subunit ClpA